MRGCQIFVSSVLLKRISIIISASSVYISSSVSMRWNASCRAIIPSCQLFNPKIAMARLKKTAEDVSPSSISLLQQVKASW